VPPSPILPVKDDTTLIMAKLDALMGRMDLSEKKTYAQSEEFLDFKASNVAVLDCVNLKFAEVFGHFHTPSVSSSQGNPSDETFSLGWMGMGDKVVSHAASL
jgi:hypothetical protein